LFLATAGSASGEDGRAAERRLMVETIESMALSIESSLGKVGLDGRVLVALQRVPRHEFLPSEMSPLAYANRALPIGFGQTISQPFIVALVSDLLQRKPGHRVRR